MGADSLLMDLNEDVLEGCAIVDATNAVVFEE